MPDKEKIVSYPLEHDHVPHSFAIRTMEEIDIKLGGITDKPHRHNYYSVIWPITATGKHIIDFKEYPIQPHHIFFVSPDQVHQVITDPNPTGFVILFTPEFLGKNSIREDFISNLKIFHKSDETPPLPITEKMVPQLELFANQMLQAFQSDNEMRFEIIGSYLKLFLIECNGHCSLSFDSNTQNVEVGKTIVRNFKQEVEIHFSKWHQVQDYAEKLNISPNYLNDIIKSNLDVSAKNYIQNRIILEAKRMAVFTQKSSKEIGFDLGFEDPSHFSKFFKTNTGISLQQFKDSV